MTSIVIFSDGVYPFSTGGSHRYVYEVARKMRLPVKVVVPHLHKDVEIATPNLDVNKIGGLGFELERFNYCSNSVLKKLKSYLKNYSSQIRKYAKDENYAINVHYLPALASIMFKRGFQVSYFFHGPWSMEYYFNLVGRIQNYSLTKKYLYLFFVQLFMILIYLMEFFSLRRASQVYVTTEYMKSVLMKYFFISEKRIAVVGAGIDLTVFQHVEKTSKIPRLVTLRRLEHRMGLRLLLDACIILKKRGVVFQLDIGGKGPLSTYLSRLIIQLELEKFVKLHGFIPEEELSSFLGRADLFVLPSIALEGFGLVILEAFACNTPVIAFARGGPAEILSKVSEHLVVKEVSSLSLADAIEKLLANPNMLRSIPVYEVAKSHYNWEKVAARIETKIMNV